MNSLRLAHMHISPLRVQQGLFASLIVQLMLLAIQQFQRWEQANEAAAVRQAFIAHTLVSSQLREPVSITRTPATARTLMPVDGPVSQDRQPQQPRWVF